MIDTTPESIPFEPITREMSEEPNIGFAMEENTVEESIDRELVSEDSKEEIEDQ